MDDPAKTKNLHILVMAGGSGTRFWPKSRRSKPKQLLKLWGDKTLLEHTLDRFLTILPPENIWIITTEALMQSTKAALGPQYHDIHFLGEPTGKNTAPCILWGLLEIYKMCPQATVAVMPADHFIEDSKTFLKAITEAASQAQSKKALITLGIKPNRPETGYGYIEIKKTLQDKDIQALQTIEVQKFVEKPDLKTANHYLKSGNYLWNAGMFIFTVDMGIRAFNDCMPKLIDIFKQLPTLGLQNVYKKIEAKDAISFDYGIMEVAASKGIPVLVIPTKCGWNDVGSFCALEEIDRTTSGNVISLDAACNIVQTDTGLVALLGVNDLVVVRDHDVVLVAAKDRAQDIRLLLEKVKPKHADKL